MRINKYLSLCGIASRRHSEELIKKGFVKVNGVVETDLSTQIKEDDKVTFKDKVIMPKETVYYLLNKPAGYVCTKSDPHAKHTIYELLPADNSLFSVGRLDKDTTGLIIVTNDGNYTQELCHPSKIKEKEYIVGLRDEITASDINKLITGVNLKDGKTQPARVLKIDPKIIKLIITEGKKRQVKRMIEAVGNRVIKLHRVRVGNINLGNIAEGKYQELNFKDRKDD